MGKFLVGYLRRRKLVYHHKNVFGKKVTNGELLTKLMSKKKKKKKEKVKNS